jgi:predicted enzyme related to lactoylglutathione lyase
VNLAQFETQITFIYVRDLDVTAAFYEGILSFPLVLDQGECRIVQTSADDRGYLGYCQSSKSIPVDKSGSILTLVSNQVDEWYDYLISKGVEVLGEPNENPRYEIYQFFLKDPDGYILEIQSFLSPEWKKGKAQAAKSK